MALRRRWNRKPQSFMRPEEVREVVRVVFAFVTYGRPSEVLDLRVVRHPGSGDLGVAVDHGAPGPPEAVPHEERVLCLRVFFEGLAHPFEGYGDVVVHLLRREGERVVIVEDDEAVEAVVLGHVRGRDRMRASDATEDIRRRSLLGHTERVPAAIFDLAPQEVWLGAGGVEGA